MFGLSPYLLGGTAIAFVIATGAAGWKGYEFGGNAQKVICERRVDALQKAWEIEVGKAKAANEAWTKALTQVLEAGNKEAAEAQAEIAELNKKVQDYEATLSNSPACLLTQPDVDKLR